MDRGERARRRVSSGRTVDVRDWEKRGEVLKKWNDELCSCDTLPEVEIISLLEEQIPKYKLRADALTDFGGYENQDWYIPSPALQIEEADLKLSPDQIRETFNYFLLCSERVSQMTKTYDDIEAVTRLLEEKEKDLELTARIGKQLLQQNTKLENTISSLETDLKAAHEKITQLSHESQQKAQLLQILTSDMEEFASESGSPTGKVSLELLQKKVSSLENENRALKSECTQLAVDTDDIEAKERQLLSELTGQLSTANTSMNYLEDELDRQKEENRLQHEQILTLTSKLQDTELKLHKVLAEHEEMSSLLQITKDNQGSLAVELAEFKARYYEIETLLHDAQEQLRKLRRKQMPVARSSIYSSLTASAQPPYDSLQSELEMSMHSEMSADSGISNSDNMAQYRKIFETVRCASQSSLSSAESMGSLSSGIGGVISSSALTTGPRMSCKSQNPSVRRSSGSIYSTSSLGYPSLDSHSDYDSGQTDSDDGYPGPPKKGVPGIPGAADLETALRRLSPAEILSRRANLQHGPTYGGYDGDTYLPFGCRTPESIMSSGSGNYRWKLPEKLQIVKPMEGSQTLHHWSQLATPNFGGLLEERPGVKIRGGKELEDMGLESYGLSDLEEDEEYSNPGKMFEMSQPTYTFTNSTVMHPDDGTFVTQSCRGSKASSICSSVQNSPPRTPVTLSRRNSTTTFSTTYGLAKVLNERGIKAVTPSCLPTPTFTPTATPCNSPDCTPAPSRSSSPEPSESFSIPQLILSSMPQFLQQTVGVGAKKKVPVSRPPKRTRKDVGLVGQIERIGITNIMGTPGALSLSAGMYARPSLTSPMAQLTCLLPSQSKESSLHNKPILEHEEKSKKVSSPPPPELGVPGKPGSGTLNRRLEQLNSRRQRRQGGGMTRPDLGTVSTLKKPPDQLQNQQQQQQQQQQSSTLGTLSSLLFGRKGGFL